MKQTKNYKLNLPELTDDADVAVLNANAEILDGHKHVMAEVTDLAYATKAEAEAGTDGTKLMSPLRVKEAIQKLAPSPTDKPVTIGANSWRKGELDTEGSYWYLCDVPLTGFVAAKQDALIFPADGESKGWILQHVRAEVEPSDGKLSLHGDAMPTIPLNIIIIVFERGA